MENTEAGAQGGKTEVAKRATKAAPLGLLRLVLLELRLRAVEIRLEVLVLRLEGRVLARLLRVGERENDGDCEGCANAWGSRRINVIGTTLRMITCKQGRQEKEAGKGGRKNPYGDSDGEAAPTQGKHNSSE